MITIGFYATTRASDQAHLLASDVTVEQNGIVLDVRVGKTTGRSALPRRRHPLLCPRAAWLAWLRASGQYGGRPSGPAFRRIDRHDTVQRRAAEASVLIAP